MRLNKGSMVDYILPTAIVGLVLGLGLFYLVQNKSILNFTSASNNMEVNEAKSQGIVNAMGAKQYKAGDLGGNSSKPVLQCSFGSCIIDYGDFILTGIPQDFAEYLESAGTSGSTDKLISLIEQIADQLEEQGDLSGAEEFRYFSNLGHYVSDIQEAIEAEAKNCESNSNPRTCFRNAVMDPTKSILKPAILDAILPVYTGKNCHLLGQNAHTLMPIVMKKTSFPNNEINEKMGKYYKSIMDNSKYKDHLKGVVQELYLNLADTSVNLHTKMYCMNYASGCKTHFYDPLTGGYLGYLPVDTSAGITEVIKPKTSKSTDLTSALMCSAGWNKSTGDKCHKK